MLFMLLFDSECASADQVALGNCCLETSSSLCEAGPDSSSERSGSPMSASGERAMPGPHKIGAMGLPALLFWRVKDRPEVAVDLQPIARNYCQRSDRTFLVGRDKRLSAVLQETRSRVSKPAAAQRPSHWAPGRDHNYSAAYQHDVFPVRLHASDSLRPVAAV